MTTRETPNRRYDTAPPTQPSTHNRIVMGAFSVAALAVVLVSTAVMTGAKVAPLPIGEIVESRDLFFRDASRGRIAVYDGETRRIITRFEKGEGAFVRQSMRALNHTRRVSNLDMGRAYQLTRTDKGIMLLSDPATGERIKLNAFGRVAIDSFTRFLPSSGKAQTTGTTEPKEGQQKAQTTTRQKGA